MAQAQGWTPVAEPTGWTPVAETPRADFSTTNEKDASGKSVVRQVGDFLNEATSSVNPVKINQALQSAFWHPLDTAKGMLAAQDQVRQAAHEAFKRGDYVTGIAKTIDWLIPVLGPRLSAAGDDLQRGDVGAGLGKTVDVAAQTMAPAALRNVRVQTPPILTNRNPMEAAAVQFAERERIPVDAATATGSPFVAGVQKLAGESLGGSTIGANARAAQATALDATGHRLADQSFPRSVTPEGAGSAVTDALTGKIKSHSQYSDTAYERLRAIEADPKNTRQVSMAIPMTEQGTGKVIPTRTTVSIPLPVDLRSVRAAFKPVYERLTRQYPILKQQASAGYKALENIVNGRDFAPLTEAEADLGAIKEIARGADMPELRNMSQGLAAQAVKLLDAQIQKTAATAGPEAVRALKDGRASTMAKYQTADVLDRIKDEPVQAYRQMTAPKDAGIDLLRTVKREAPQVMSDVARAYLDDLLKTATSDGGFAHADKLWAEWQKLGSETKSALFPKTGQIADLNHFFLLAKRIAQNPNPSGTALTLWKGGELTGLVTHPTIGIPYSVSMAALSKLLHSPTGVKLLTRGLSLPIGNKAAATAYVAELTKAVGDVAQLAPAAAEADRAASGESTPPR